jgi:acetyl esterase
MPYETHDSPPGTGRFDKPGARAHLKLVGAGARIDPTAAHILMRLASEGPVAGEEIGLARRRYTANHWSLLTVKQQVGSIYHVRSSRPNVPPLTFIRPRGSKPMERLAALVFLHGGGWTFGELATYEPLCRQLANATGRVVVWIDYRLAPEHPYPAALDDIRNTFDWLRENADWLGIDCAHVAVCGDGAGGNLAAVTCLEASRDWLSISPEIQILIYPWLDLTASAPSQQRPVQRYPTVEYHQWCRRNYAGGEPDPTEWRLSPLFAEQREGLAPAIILLAGYDPLLDEAVTYGLKLRAVGVPVETISFPSMIHGFVQMGGVLSDANLAVERIAQATELLAQPR